jgi:prepilin-type N-terminal cleavage/methylation domain-containing protein
MKTRSGFTLIELLISVGIIAVLIGILVPSLNAARSRGRRTACTSNLHQVGLGMRSYLDSNNDIFPYASYMPSIGASPIGIPQFDSLPDGPPQAVGIDEVKPIYIADVLLSHVGGATTVFNCPNDVIGAADIERDAPNAGKTYFSTEKSSYKYRASPPWLWLGGRSAANFIKAVAERSGTHFNENTFWILSDYNGFHAPKAQPGRWRYLFYDGHVSDFENL